MFQTNLWRKLKHILCPIAFSRKSCRLCTNVEKYSRAGQATEDNMAHAHCMLDPPKAANTPSEYVVLTPFPLQQWMHERFSMFR